MHAYILAEGTIRETQDHAEVRRAKAERKRMWVDLTHRTPEAESLLADCFGIHPLVAEDIWGERSVPKIDRFPDYTYIVTHGVRRGSGPTRLELWVLDVVVGKDWIITEHGDTPATDTVRSQLDRLPKLLERGPAWVAHAFLDAMIDRFVPLVDDLGGSIDDVERGIVATVGMRGKSMLPLLSSLKRSIQTIYRISNHQRVILRRLAYDGYPEIPSDAIPYFRDVHDHFVRVSDLIEMYREVMANAVEAYLSLQSNHMNEIVKTLTLMSTIMLPLSFIAGVYGMNFRYLPVAEYEHGFYIVVALMAAVAIGIGLAFRKRGWI